MKIAESDMLVLCGGLGTRFQEVSTTQPKALASVGNKPFLDYLIDDYVRQGFTRIILCTGHLSKLIEDHYKDGPYADYIVISEESQPLGTGGAIRNAQPHIYSDAFFVANGDSICSVNYGDILSFHDEKKSSLTIVVSAHDGRDDIGVIRTDDNSRILSFSEKNSQHYNSFSSAGIYLFDKQSLEQIPTTGPQSLEISLFPSLVGKNIYAYRADSKLLDIGTQERYNKAHLYFNN
jgi:NDP-sugar pyrophosphorylase family protein